MKNSTIQKPTKPMSELVDYILQDDIHNRLTPRVVDIAYSAFMIGRGGKNPDDGGPCDWFNDTKPMVIEQLTKIRKDLTDEESKVSWQPIETLPKSGVFLVFMPDEPNIDKQIQVAIAHPNITTIGGLFSFDCSPVTHWMPLSMLPPPPRGSNK
jgi:hypothetical protein